MEIKLKEVDINGKTLGITKINVDITEKELKEYDKLFCKCTYLKENPNSNPKYVENYKGVSHGWICPKCKNFVQIG